MPNRYPVIALVALLPGLSACERKPVEPRPVAESTDGPLAREIVVDPAREAKRAPASVGPCRLDYDLAWARRLPEPLALYPGAKLAEATGSDAAGCRRRIVSFTAPAAPARVLAFYRSRVSAAGYSAEHLVEQGKDVLGGTKGEAAYYLTITPAKGAAAVDLVSNEG